MSLLPLIVDFAADDDFYSPLAWCPWLEAAQPRAPCGNHRNWCLANRNGAPRASQLCPRRNLHRMQHSTIGKDGFEVSLDVKQFAPNEISVKTVDNSVVIEGKHEEKQDDQGFVSRHFVRRYVLPKEYDVQQVASTLSSDGVLTVKAPPPTPKPIEGRERVVQIQHTEPAHQSVTANGEAKKEESKK